MSEEIIRVFKLSIGDVLWSGLAAREPGLNAGQSGLGRQIPKLVIRLAHGGRKNAEFSK
jgi:hypothetical protein